MANPHVNPNFIITGSDGQTTVIPAGAPATPSKKLVFLREVIQKIKDGLGDRDWVEIPAADVGNTGYLDLFKPNEPNGWGYDEHGRAFIQLAVRIVRDDEDPEEEILRVFERYQEENKLLVCTGTGYAYEIFSSALSDAEFMHFKNLVLSGTTFKQNDDYYEPLTVARV